MKMRISTIYLLIASLSLGIHGNAFAEAETDVTAEGYTETYDTFYSTVSWCKNGEMNIYGEFYYPSDFDETKTYPVVILSHGGSVTHDIYEKAEWTEYLTGQGYIAYAFDFCGGSQKSLSDGVLEDHMSPSTESSDLLAVIDFVESKSFYDPENLFLMGQSFGGLITGITAGERDSEIAGEILLYPAFLVAGKSGQAKGGEADIKEEGGGGDAGNEHPASYYEELAEMDLAALLTKYTGDVLIIHGEADKTTPIEDSINAVENIYEDGQASLVTIEGEKSLHAFELIYPEGKEKAREAVGEFLAAHIN